MARSAEEQELVEKLSRLVDERFARSHQDAFNHYANHRGNNAIGKEELKELLKDANVGNGLTRGAWVNGIMAKLDINRDGFITWQVFQSVIESSR